MDIKFRNFSFILFAETHGYLNDFKIIKRIITQQKPDYVLYELAEDKKFIALKNKEKEGQENKKDFKTNKHLKD